jgi:uncharacterized damage-inducible protein DinB
MTPPRFPAGEHAADTNPSAEKRAALIDELDRLPEHLRGLVAGLSDKRLDTKYVNWTVRQIVNHLADSHMNAFVRFKLALTEDNPTIKPYDESAWSRLADTKDGDPEVSLQLLDAMHWRWVFLLRAMSGADFARTYFHPEFNRTNTLGEALDAYAYHGRHHAAQIDWLRQQPGW